MQVASFIAAKFPEFAKLTPAQRAAVEADFRDMLLAEYDTPDDTVDRGIAEENAVICAREYSRRIRPASLESYAKTLLA